MSEIAHRTRSVQRLAHCKPPMSGSVLQQDNCAPHDLLDSSFSVMFPPHPVLDTFPVSQDQYTLALSSSFPFEIPLLSLILLPHGLVSRKIDKVIDLNYYCRD